MKYVYANGMPVPEGHCIAGIDHYLTEVRIPKPPGVLMSEVRDAIQNKYEVTAIRPFGDWFVVDLRSMSPIDQAKFPYQILGTLTIGVVRNVPRRSGPGSVLHAHLERA